MLYTYFYLNKNLRFVSYLYYVKYIIFANITIFFRYIDLNIFKYFNNNYEANIIQKSILFDNKYINNCTTIISNFYNRIKK